jgi:response regulator RpfG family c-di-GMP phosphodiesterase
VNEGHIFGFARKPCKPDVLVALVTSAVNEHQHIVQERELLEETLQGSIKALTELLAVSSPAASGRATRVARYACDLAATLNCSSWEISVAATVSQLGCLTLPPDLAERVCRGGCLTEEEQRLVHRLPWIAEDILARIPRLEGVRAILNHQNTRFDQVGPVGESVGTVAPMGARILAVAVAFDTLDCQGVVVEDILKRLHARHGLYDPKVLEALSVTTSFIGAALETRDVLLSEVEIGMVLLGDVLSPTGVMLIAKGQNITVSLHERIRTYWSGFADRQHVRVASAARR